jgi:hypothetical protein
MKAGHHWQMIFMSIIMIDKILEIILSLSLITIGIMALIFVIRDSINKDDDIDSEV